MGKYRKVISSDNKFHRWEKEGDSIEGSWLGIREGAYDNEIGRVETHDGTIAFSLTAGLKDMALIPTGTQVRITYVGSKPSKFGNNMKLFDVEMDESAELKADDRPPQKREKSRGDKNERAGQRRFEAADEDLPF